jgi:nitrite reductase/ring-hydroxylating ferredoxin subunit
MLLQRLKTALGGREEGYNLEASSFTQPLSPVANPGVFTSRSNVELSATSDKALQAGLKLPLGWYVVMPASKVGSKKSLGVTLFGQELVVWRDAKGQPVLMERYCSHLGASLADAPVKAGCVECPFHGWQFNSGGQCVKAPAVEQIPKTARQNIYPVIEKYGFIWAWYGSAQPLYDLPVIPAALHERQHFMPVRFAFHAKTTARRVLENVYDQYHIIKVHGLPAPAISLNLYDYSSSASATVTSITSVNAAKALPPTSEQNPNLKSLTKELPLEARFGALLEAKAERYLGPAGVIARLLGLEMDQVSIFLESWPTGHILTISFDGALKYYALIAITPVSENFTIQHFILMVKKTPSFWRNLAYYILFGLQSEASGRQDMPIWDKLKAAGGGAYTKNDLGVLKYRDFYNKWVAAGQEGIV